MMQRRFISFTLSRHQQNMNTANNSRFMLMMLILQNVRCTRLMRRTAQDIIDVGQKLIEVKQQLGHGNFEAWLKAEFDWSEWTVRKFI